MTDAPLLPYYPDLKDLSIDESYLASFKNEPRYKHINHSTYGKILRLRNESLHYGLTNPIAGELIKAYSFYGAGYSDAARRYRRINRALESKISYNRITQAGRLEIVFTHTRGTVMFFASFIVLVFSALALSVWGVAGNSEDIAGAAPFALVSALLSGLAWLRRAEVERERFRSL